VTSLTQVFAAQTITGTYKVQYQVTFTQVGIGADTGSNQVLSLSVNGGTATASSASTLPPATWYDANTVLTYTYSSTVATSPASGKQYVLTNTSPASPYTVTAAHTITGTYKVQYQVTFTASSLPVGTIADTTGTVVAVNGTGSTSYSASKSASALAFSDWFDNGATLKITYTTPINSTTTMGKGYVLSSIGGGGTVTNNVDALTVSAATTITGYYNVWALVGTTAASYQQGCSAFYCGQYSDPSGLEAILTMNSSPVSGKSIGFTIGPAGSPGGYSVGPISWSATTNSSGVALDSTPSTITSDRLTQAPGSYTAMAKYTDASGLVLTITNLHDR
jgi:hypothetical protein